MGSAVRAPWPCRRRPRRHGLRPLISLPTGSLVALAPLWSPLPWRQRTSTFQGPIDAMVPAGPQGLPQVTVPARRGYDAADL